MVNLYVPFLHLDILRVVTVTTCTILVKGINLFFLYHWQLKCDLFKWVCVAFLGIQSAVDKRKAVKCCRAANRAEHCRASRVEPADKNSSERGYNRSLASR